jgi:ligand-binding SRPBCC domain-containing protein
MAPVFQSSDSYRHERDHLDKTARGLRHLRTSLAPHTRSGRLLPVTTTFTIRTTLAAPPSAVFAASLSIDNHLGSMAASGERAVDGVTSGSIGLGQSVTWKARHLGVIWTMTSQVTELDEPTRFVDEQQRGPFRYFRHEHTFRPTEQGTEMEDAISFAAPLGPLGWIAERSVLGWYLPRLIRARNAYLKTALG